MSIKLYYIIYYKKNEKKTVVKMSYSTLGIQ